MVLEDFQAYGKRKLERRYFSLYNDCFWYWCIYFTSSFYLLWTHLWNSFGNICHICLYIQCFCNHSSFPTDALVQLLFCTHLKKSRHKSKIVFWCLYCFWTIHCSNRWFTSIQQIILCKLSYIDLAYIFICSIKTLDTWIFLYQSCVGYWSFYVSYSIITWS